MDMFGHRRSAVLQQQQPLTALCPRLPGWAGTRRNIHPTHHPDHHWIFISFHLLQPTIYSILPVQITCLAIFLHNLSPRPFWSTSWSGALHLIFHTFLYPVSVFYFAVHVHTIAACFAVVPILLVYHLFLICLSTLYLGLISFTLKITHRSDHSYVCLLKCHLIFFPDRPGLTSM